LHNAIRSLLSEVLSSTDGVRLELIISLLREGGLAERLVAEFTAEDSAAKARVRHRHARVGYMGHLQLLCNEIRDYAAKEPECAAVLTAVTGWSEILLPVVDETARVQSEQLGGGVTDADRNLASSSLASCQSTESGDSMKPKLKADFVLNDSYDDDDDFVLNDSYDDDDDDVIPVATAPDLRRSDDEDDEFHPDSFGSALPPQPSNDVVSDSSVDSFSTHSSTSCDSWPQPTQSWAAFDADFSAFPPASGDGPVAPSWPQEEQSFVATFVEPTRASAGQHQQTEPIVGSDAPPASRPSAQHHASAEAGGFWGAPEPPPTTSLDHQDLALGEKDAASTLVGQPSDRQEAVGDSCATIVTPDDALSRLSLEPQTDSTGDGVSPPRSVPIVRQDVQAADSSGCPCVDKPEVSGGHEACVETSSQCELQDKAQYSQAAHQASCGEGAVGNAAPAPQTKSSIQPQSEQSDCASEGFDGTVVAGKSQTSSKLEQHETATGSVSGSAQRLQEQASLKTEMPTIAVTHAGFDVSQPQTIAKVERPGDSVAGSFWGFAAVAATESPQASKPSRQEGLAAKSKVSTSAQPQDRVDAGSFWAKLQDVAGKPSAAKGGGASGTLERIPAVSSATVGNSSPAQRSNVDFTAQATASPGVKTLHAALNNAPQGTAFGPMAGFSAGAGAGQPWATAYSGNSSGSVPSSCLSNPTAASAGAEAQFALLGEFSKAEPKHAAFGSDSGLHHSRSAGNPNAGGSQWNSGFGNLQPARLADPGGGMINPNVASAFATALAPGGSSQISAAAAAADRSWVADFDPFFQPSARASSNHGGSKSGGVGGAAATDGFNPTSHNVHSFGALNPSSNNIDSGFGSFNPSASTSSSGIGGFGIPSSTMANGGFADFDPSSNSAPSIVPAGSFDPSSSNNVSSQSAVGSSSQFGGFDPSAISAPPNRLAQGQPSIGISQTSWTSQAGGFF